MKHRRRGHGARRVVTVTVLTLGTVPVLSATAFAQDIGDHYSPDPLTALQAWAIYGGVVGGGFLIAIAFTLFSGRRTGPERYRPGRPWTHDEVWLGDEPSVAEGERPHVALPGAGGARGNW